MTKYSLEYNNTVIDIPSRMPAATNIILTAREEFGVSSENWPTHVLSFGYHEDRYYAEMWTDGMDWNLSVWLLEAVSFDNPKPILAIHFNDDFERLKIQGEDWDILLKGLCYFRRDSLLSNTGDQFVYNDRLWPYLKLQGGEFGDLKEFTYDHHSMKPATLFINPLCVPMDRYT